MVNDQHTKVGITKKSFASRCKGYIDNFDNKVNFIPLAIVPSDQLDEAEDLILGVLRKKYTKVGRSRERLKLHHNSVLSITYCVKIVYYHLPFTGVY